MNYKTFMKSKIATFLLFTCALLSLSGCNIMDTLEGSLERRKSEKYEEMLRPFTGTWNMTRYSSKNPNAIDTYMTGIASISFTDNRMTVFMKGSAGTETYSYVKKTGNIIEDTENLQYMENGTILVQGTTRFQDMSYVFKCTRKIDGKAYHTLELNLPAGTLYLKD